MPLRLLLDRLADDIGTAPENDVPGNRFADPHLASSVLQKALRREDRFSAHVAARSLAEIDPPRLWRRLSAIACEDFGLSDLDLTARVVMAASNGEWRRKVGGDATVARYLVHEMVRYPRDRRTDELAMWSAWARQHFTPWAIPEIGLSAPLAELMQWAIRLSLKCEVGTAPGGKKAYVPRQCDLELAAMRGKGWIDETTYLVCLRARQSSKTVLPVMLALLQSRVGDHPTKVRENKVPRVEVLAGVPTYGLDGFTRPGQAALWALTRRHRALAATIAGLSTSKATRALTAMLFEIEGGICTRELYNPLSEELREHSRGCWSGIGRQRFNEGVRALLPLLPELNAIRLSNVEAT